MTAAKYLDIIVNSLANEPSDGIFETQLSYISMAISQYTPQDHRDKLFDRAFDYAYGLITKSNDKAANRTVILKDKMTLLAKTQEKKKFLLEWKNKKIENLKDHELSIGQQWRAVTKALSLIHI